MTINSELTKEKIQWLHDACEEAAAAGVKLTMNPNELLMFTSALLAAHEQGPVYQVLIDDSWVDVSKGAMDAQQRVGATVRTLYTHPAPSIPAPPNDDSEILSSINFLSSHPDGKKMAAWLEELLQLRSVIGGGNG